MRAISARHRTTELLIRSPGLLPALLVVPVLLVFTLEQGGYQPTTWYPAALFLLAALVVAAVALPRPGTLARASAAAAALLFAYAAWSYLSIAWADDQGVAWDGANRTALYAIVFALLALWPIRGRPAAWTVGALAIAITVVGAGELIACAASADPESWFISRRFSEPTGYPNANVALWMIAFFPCVAFGATRRVPPALRAIALAAAVVAAELALLGQSRAWQFAAPIAAIVFLAAARERTRATLTLAVVVAVAAIASPAVFDVYDAFIEGRPLGPAIEDARNATLIAALVMALIGYAAAAIDRSVRVPASLARATSSGLIAIAVAVPLITVVVAFTVGDAASRVSRAWDSFVQGEEPEGPGVRFGATLGSQRYDYWRVAWHQFERAPLIGAGADNFQQDYLRERRSDQEPRYPHNVGVRTLSQTGLVGVALLAAALAFALLGAARAIRARPPGVGAAAAVGATAAFAYWFVHAFGDWLYEYPGVAAPAFALLGLACGLQPRSFTGRSRAAAIARRGPVRLAAAAGVVVLALAMLAPWLAERHITSAAAKWRADPDAAFDELSKAAALNPLSIRPRLVGGTIALQMGDPERAREEFAEALERDGRDTYALLELGVLTANAGDAPAGLALVARARELNPRDDVIAAAYRRLRNGRQVDIDEVNDALLRRSRLRLRVNP